MAPGSGRAVVASTSRPTRRRRRRTRTAPRLPRRPPGSRNRGRTRRRSRRSGTTRASRTGRPPPPRRASPRRRGSGSRRISRASARKRRRAVPCGAIGGEGRDGATGRATPLHETSGPPCRRGFAQVETAAPVSYHRVCVFLGRALFLRVCDLNDGVCCGVSGERNMFPRSPRQSQIE